MNEIPLNLQLALFGAKGLSVVELPLLNATVGTSLETLWPESADVAFPAAASTMTVSSASANDTSAGTGARTVRIEGLDANHAELSETVTLNGQTGVSTVGEYLRVNKLTVLTAGSGGSNAGIVYIGTGTVTTGKPAVVVQLMPAGHNRSLSGIYTVPAGKSAALTQLAVSGDTGKFLQIVLRKRPSGGLFSTVLLADFTQAHSLTPVYGEAFTEKTDIELRVVTNTGSTSAQGIMSLLVK